MNPRTLLRTAMVMALGVSGHPVPALSAELCVATLSGAMARLRSQTREPRVIVFAAPSGGGKTTLMEMLIQNHPGEFRHLIETTTRAPRGTEVQGKDYHFVSREAFEGTKARGEFVATSEMAGNFYGVSRVAIESTLAKGTSAILLSNPQNFSAIQKAFPNQTVTFYISPPSLKVLEQRLRSRGTESEEAIQKRLAIAKRELENLPEADLHLVNDDLSMAYSKVEAILARSSP